MSVVPAKNRDSRSWSGNIAYSLSVVVLLTSLIDLFINRLLFRAGPDVMQHLTSSSAVYFAVVGRISLTMEQILLFVILGFVSLFFLHGDRSVVKLLGSLLLVIVGSSLLLYVSLPPELAWAASTLLVMSVAATISGFAFLRISGEHGLPRKRRVIDAFFLAFVVLSFLFPLYYRMYLLAGAAGLGSLPVPFEAYLAGVYSVMASMIFAFAYALQAPAPGYTLVYRNFAKAAFLPTILVVPTLYAMISSFFVTQILSMVVAMSTDFVLSHTLLEALVLLWWFYLTAVLVLLLKSHYSANRMLRQEAVGLLLIMSTTYLFNYPYYLMLGTVGLILLSYPLLGTANNV
jgi:hypothetical protein